MKGLFTAASITALLMTAPAWAQNSANNTSLSSQDRQFIQQADAGNMAEATLGQLAEQKAATPAVQEFGRWMATDHSFALHSLEVIAKSLDAWQQPQPTPAQQDLTQRLQRLNGRQFDREYMQAMVQTHEQTIPKFQKEASQGQDLKLKTYAQNLLPVLRQHLAEAQDLAGGRRHIAADGGAAGIAGSSSPPPSQRTR